MKGGSNVTETPWVPGSRALDTLPLSFKAGYRSVKGT